MADKFVKDTTLGALFGLGGPPPSTALGLGINRPSDVFGSLAGGMVPKPPTHITITGVTGRRTYPSFELYKDFASQWRWRFQDTNYKIIADSSESYWNRADAVHGIAQLMSPYQIWIEIHLANER